MTAFDTLARIAASPAAHSISCGVPPVREAHRIFGVTMCGYWEAQVEQDLREE